MTVRELIEKLQACNPAHVAWLEGCDCVGFAGSVESFDDLNAIAIRRDPPRLDRLHLEIEQEMENAILNAEAEAKARAWRESQK